MAVATKSKKYTKPATTETEPKIDIYESITNKIVAQLESGVLPWNSQWKKRSCNSRPLRSCGTPYNGVNVIVLWLASMEANHSSPFWMTYNQAKELGGNVKKGEKGTRVVYASTFTKEDEDGKDVTIPFLKSYVVFNADQCEGLPAKFYPEAKEEEITNEGERIENADAFFAALGSKVSYGGSRACYIPSLDAIEMPNFEDFVSPEAFYSVLSHEHIHWTAKRVDRELGGKRFGDEGYAMEELVAELGAAFVCADLGINSMAKPDHAAYIQSWIKVLKGNHRSIFTAASMASKSVEYLTSLQKD
jgi:antirestriction protein ArdC